MAVEDSLDIFGSDPFGRDYLYGLSTGRDGQGLAPYGTRYAENLSQPTTAKGRGYLGNVGTMQDPMTELSASSDFGGRTVQYPLIVPTLTAQELNLLRSGGEPTQEIYGKAQQYALGRLSRGQDPFVTTQELRYPQPQAVDTRPYDQMQATPRGFTSGLFSDVFGRTLNMPSIPRTGIPALDLLYMNRNPVLNMMGVGDVQKTAERISYDQPLTTGSGMTLKPREEAIFAGMAVAPLVGEAANLGARAGRAGARMVGERIAENVTMGRSSLPSLLAEPRASLFAVEPTYRGSHTAPNAKTYGATLDDLTQIMPENVYTSQGKNLYGVRDSVIDHQWWMAAKKARGNPDAEVEVFRAVPKGVKDINSGDWVSTSRKYAEDHGESALNGEYEIISKKVKAKTLSTAGDPQEYGYNPSFEYPQQAALDLAQQRAALPVEQGGLGLAAGNTPDMRAAADRWNIDAYHASDADIMAFDSSKLGSNTSYLTGGDPDAVKSAMRGHWFSDRDLTNKDPRGFVFGDVSYPVKLRNPIKINDKEFGSTSYIIKDPANIRSRFAAFDPFRKDVATATAMGVALPDLLAQPVNQYQNPYETLPMYTDPFGNTIGSSIR